MKPSNNVVEVSAESIATIRILRQLPFEARQEIAECTRGFWYGAGHQIVTHNDPTHEVCLIIAGLVRIAYISPAGKEVSFRELSAGDSFGEVAAIDREMRSATVFAIQETLIATVSSDKFWALLTTYPAVNTAVLQGLCSLVRRLSDRLVEFSTLDVNSRIRAEILRLARDNMSGPNSGEIAPVPTHQNIANRIGTHREAVTREISKLTRAGILKRTCSLMLVQDVSRLEQLVYEESDPDRQ